MSTDGYTDSPISLESSLLNLNCSKSILRTDIDKLLLCNETKTVRISSPFLKVPCIIKSSKFGKHNKTYFRNYQCKPICEIGHTIRFYEDKFLWKCTPCYNNSVKNQIGNKPCIPCARGWVAYTNKTICYDTYKNISLKFTDNSSLIMMLASGLMLSSLSCTIFFFIKHNETPVVKSSNLILSSVQLVGQLLTVVMMPFLFIGEPNSKICVLRPICIGVFLTATTGVTMIKTRSLLRIFQKAIVMTDKEKSR